MKYIWEEDDIKPGQKVMHLGSTTYIIASADDHGKTDMGFVCYNIETHRVTPVYAKHALVEMFNTQGIVPVFD